jgi:hypothetical protein
MVEVATDRPFARLSVRDNLSIFPGSADFSQPSYSFVELERAWWFNGSSIERCWRLASGDLTAQDRWSSFYKAGATELTEYGKRRAYVEAMMRLIGSIYFHYLDVAKATRH